MKSTVLHDFWFKAKEIFFRKQAKKGEAVTARKFMFQHPIWPMGTLRQVITHHLKANTGV